MEKRKPLIEEGLVLLLVFTFLIAACQGDRNVETPQVEVPVETEALPLTGNEPSLVIRDQVFDGNVVVIEEVVSDGLGWLVIYAEKDGKPGQAIGRAPVHSGQNTNLIIKIDPELATEVMYAELHRDAGKLGTFEFPGPDAPVEVNGETVTQSFRAVLEGVDEVTTSTPGKVIAQSQVTKAATTPQPGAPSTIKVADQEVKDGIVVVEEATSNGPGWLVIYSEQDGQPVEVIGFSAVQDGENSNIQVQVDASKVTPELYALLHTDAGQIGTFEYPGPDTPILTNVRGILDRFKASTGEAVSVTPSVETTPDADTLRVIALDQPIRGGTVKVAEVVSDGPGWLGIHIITPDGKIGSAIGSALLQDGLNQELVVQIDDTRATRSMNAMLHHDGGNVGVWEYPGPDAPVMVNGQMVMMYFNVTGGLVGQEIVINISSGETPFLTDGQGMSLYVSLADKPNRSLCDAECHKTWLPLLSTGQVTAGTGVDISKLGVTVLTNGDKQVTYNSLPLYYYAGDSSPGDTNGQGIDGQWFLSTP